MPRATVSTDAERFELKTCPGGYVKLRPLSFGQMLYRRDQATHMTIEQEVQSNRRQRRSQGNRRPVDPDKPEMQKYSLEMAQEWTRWYEFSNCIVEHNLEDETGTPLDFNNKMAIKVLDPRIGSEIERYIDDLNQEPDEEEFDEEGFTGRSSTQSVDSSAETLVGTSKKTS